MYLLVTNVCEDRFHYRQLLWTAMFAVFVQSLLSLRYMNSLTPDAQRLHRVAQPSTGSSIAMNVFFILLFAALAYRGIPPAFRSLLLAISVVPVAWVYIESAPAGGGGGPGSVGRRLLRRAVLAAAPHVLEGRASCRDRGPSGTRRLWCSTSSVGFPPSRQGRHRAVAGEREGPEQRHLPPIENFDST